VTGDRPSLHVSLTLRGNLIAISATGLIAAVLTVLSQPKPWVVVGIGLVFGIAAGLFQSAALRQAPEDFVCATTSREVRAALVSTNAGAWAIRLQWIMLPVVLLTWFVTRPQSILAPVAALGVFMCVRDVIALPAVLALSAPVREPGDV